MSEEKVNYTLCWRCGHPTAGHLAKGTWRPRGAPLSEASACFRCYDERRVCLLSASEARETLERVR